MGLEPIRCCHRQILSLVRLPFRHAGLPMVTVNSATLKQEIYYHIHAAIAT